MHLLPPSVLSRKNTGLLVVTLIDLRLEVGDTDGCPVVVVRRDGGVTLL